MFIKFFSSDECFVTHVHGIIDKFHAVCHLNLEAAMTLCIYVGDGSI